jgi:hypothetical protein
MSARRHLRRRTRGAATVEFALTVPILVMILMFSMYLTELVRAKLKLQEMARYAVWEMTSYALSDFAKADHDAAFEDARREAHEELVERYKDMDSVEPNGQPGNFIARYSGVQATVTNKEINFIEGGMVGLGSTNEGGGLASGILNIVNQGADWMLGSAWKFNTKGWVESEVQMSFDNRILPQRYLEEGTPGGFFQTDTFGGQTLANLNLRTRYSMYANGWHMPDGGDAIVRSRRAGQHNEGSLSEPHGLYLQVSRMTFLGLNNLLDSLGIGGVLDAVSRVLPNFFGTFVVSRNYGLDTNGIDCTNGGLRPNYPGNAFSGLHDMQDGENGLLDHDRPDCFDTAPFRDTISYDDSLYLKMFEARGEHFMGCKNPMADDPSAPPGTQEATQNDEQDDKVRCL